MQLTGMTLLWVALGGSMTLFLLSFAFIVSFRNAQYRISHTNQELLQVMNESADAIIVLDDQGRILFWNHAAELLYHWRSTETMDRDSASFLRTTASEENTIDPLTECRTLGEWSGVCSHLTKEGTEIIVESRWKIVQSKYFDRDIIMINNRDITDQKKLESQMQQTRIMEDISLMTSSLAHDLQNVLSPIEVSVRMIELDPAHPRNREVLNSIKEKTRAGLELLDRIFDAGRKHIGALKHIDLRNLIDAAIRQSPVSADGSITVKPANSAQRYYIMGNEKLLLQVISNIFINASQAMPGGGTIGIELGSPDHNEKITSQYPDLEKDQYIRISISDSGIGIPENKLERIFEPFYSSQPGKKGTGLGLTIAANIIKHHKGMITVDSRVKRGTTFHIILPLCPEPDES